MALFAGQVQTAPYQSPDYGPSVAAAREYAMAGAQGVAGMVSQVGDYFKQQGEKKKALKAASTQIQAALTLMPELSPVLSGISNNIKDENISLDDRFAEASIVGDLIKNSISAMQSQQMMNLRQQKFAASQGGGGGGGAKPTASSNGGFNPHE
jgi:conjugal transfer/entry exclusion protein